MTASACGLYIIANSVAVVVLYKRDMGMTIAESLRHRPMPLVMIFLGFFGAGYPIGLAGFHLWISSRGESTHEFLRNKQLPEEYKSRPFDTGNVFKNLYIQWFQPYVASNMRNRDKFIVGDKRFEGS
ncbi:Palmitoyltransferase ERF2 [Yarrowia sp. E02]|nr:Palmitoyltransferase ERF2 [Yarrowia sp. E02]